MKKSNQNIESSSQKPILLISKLQKKYNEGKPNEVHALK